MQTFGNGRSRGRAKLSLSQTSSDSLQISPGSLSSLIPEKALQNAATAVETSDAALKVEEDFTFVLFFVTLLKKYKN